MIGKAGGVTAAEALSVGLPMLVFEPIPGQEARNADYLVAEGAAIKGEGLGSLAEQVSFLLRPGALEQAKARAASLGRPDAADRVLDEILAFRPAID
ncbi:MAG: hypothetical protein HY077_03610 [Elusimicrobia bacterium]|nr:hypothetical protein [Elusimicrobiota bacterium]